MPVSDLIFWVALDFIPRYRKLLLCTRTGVDSYLVCRLVLSILGISHGRVWIIDDEFSKEDDEDNLEDNEDGHVEGPPPQVDVTRFHFDTVAVTTSTLRKIICKGE